MQTFVCVVESGSFSGAARRLNIGQPAVSKAVAQLEDHMAVRLLLRSTRGLMPTEAGLAFYEGAKRALEQTEEAEVAARGAGIGFAGRLRVCAAVTLASIHIIPFMEEFIDLHPDLKVELVLDDRNIDLVEEGIDVALRMGNLSDSSVTARKLVETRRVLVGTPRYFERYGTPEIPADLDRHRSVVYSQVGGGDVWTMRKGDEEQPILLKGPLYISAAQGVRSAVFSHMGIAVVSEWIFSPELESGKVISILNEWELPKIDVWAVFPTGRMASARARAFLDFVARLFGP